MGTVTVVVPFVLAQGVQEMRLVPDQRPVEQFVAAGLDPVHFGNSSLLLGSVWCGMMVEPCSGDRLSGVPGGMVAPGVPVGAPPPGRVEGDRAAGAAARERGAQEA